MTVSTRHLLVALCLALALAGCAKKSSPRAPQGEVDTYPRSYPSE
jgi:hypothetical protein